MVGGGSVGFDLYFAGMVQNEENEYSKKLGVHKLFSQLLQRSQINSWADAIRKGEVSSKLFVDSGAYTAHTKGAILDVDEYIEYVNSLDDALTLFAQVDHIPGRFGVSRSRQDILEAPKKSWENYLYMRDRVLSPHKLIPIFHQDEPFEWLQNMLEWRDEKGEPIPYIGISSSKDKSPKYREEWYWKVFSVIQRSSNPNVKTHAFGTSSTRHLELFPFTSADATSWIQTAVHGSIETDFGTITVSGVQENSKKHIKHCPISFETLREYVKSFGFELDELIYDTENTKAYTQRLKFNIAYLKRWADNYEYKGPKSFINRGLF